MNLPPDSVKSISHSEVPRTNSFGSKKLWQASQDFESIFVSFLVKAMRQSVDRSGLVPVNQGEKIFQGMLDDEYAKIVTRNGQLGLAEMIYQQMSTHVSDQEEDSSFFLKSKNNPFTLSGQNAVTRYPGQEILGAYLKQKVDEKRGLNSLLSEQIRSADTTKMYKDLIEEAAQKYGLDEHLIRGIIQQESGGDRMAQSAKGAKGLMQLMDGTASAMGVRDPYDAKENIFGGTKYLHQLMNRYQNRVPMALAAYNAGPGNIEKHQGIPPFPETLEYVKHVLGYRDLFQQIYKNLQ